MVHIGLIIWHQFLFCKINVLLSVLIVSKIENIPPIRKSSKIKKKKTAITFGEECTCISVAGLGRHCSAPSHCLNQCWYDVHWILRNKLQCQWNFNTYYASARCFWKYRLHIFVLFRPQFAALRSSIIYLRVRKQSYIRYFHVWNYIHLKLKPRIIRWSAVWYFVTNYWCLF